MLRQTKRAYGHSDDARAHVPAPTHSQTHTHHALQVRDDKFVRPIAGSSSANGNGGPRPGAGTAAGRIAGKGGSDLPSQPVDLPGPADGRSTLDAGDAEAGPAVSLTPVEDDRSRPGLVRLADPLGASTVAAAHAFANANEPTPLFSATSPGPSGVPTKSSGPEHQQRSSSPVRAAPSDEPRRTSVSELRTKWQRTASSGGASSAVEARPAGEGAQSPTGASVLSNTAIPAVPAAAQGGPARLPPGWIEQMDPATGHPFYANTSSGATQWERPC